MKMAKRLIDGMSKKKASQVEKFVAKLLDLSISNWADEANESLEEGRDEDYCVAFRNWHSLRQTRNNFEAWLDPARPLPAEE